jgi:L-idonate 5-dehydrogenase
MSASMLAAVLHGGRDLRIEERPVPVPGPGQVLLRVRRAGLCGSDLHYYTEGRCGPFVPTAPFVLGHELVGEVAALGDGVQQPAVGQRVAVNPARSCGRCEDCLGGRVNLCRHVVMLGSASTRPPTDGAFCQYLAVGAGQCVPVGPGVDDAVAAMLEPLAVALHAAHRAGDVAGKRVLVTGGGPIGLLAVMAARARGAGTVALSDPLESRRALALRVGADAALDPAAASFPDDAARLAGEGFEAVLEASGAPPALRQALGAVRRGGTVVQVGLFAEPEIALPANLLMSREIQYVGSFRYGDVFGEGARLLASSGALLSPLVSQVFPFASVSRALDAALHRNASLKVQIDLL